jgi:nitroreductase
MNLVIQTIKERRSVRNFEKKNVDKELIQDLIQVGKFAPSAENRQPWRFIVITNKNLMKELSLMVREELKKLLKRRFIKKFSIKELKDEEILKLLYGVSFSEDDLIFFDAPVVIFILTEKKLFNDESCACCAQNIMLAAQSCGLGSCWIGFASILGMKKEVMKKIGAPNGYHIAATIALGYPKEKIKKLPLRNVEADIIKWIE